MDIKFIIENLAASPIPARNYDSNFDDIRSIISDVCKGLAGHSDFIVSGFGQERWPVDVETDLAIFLEQLSDALQAIRGSQGFELFFMNKGSNASSFLRRWSHSVTDCGGDAHY